jgi:hypothetical protein
MAFQILNKKWLAVLAALVVATGG